MIIDRKKDLWKGPQGEYVALTKVESAMKLNILCDMPMCYGKTGGKWPVALICPNERALREIAEKLGEEKCGGLKHDDENFDNVCQNKAVRAEALKSIQKTCKEQKLVAFEIPQRVGFCADPWTPENEMLTAAMKLKRPAIVRRYKELVDEMYA